MSFTAYWKPTTGFNVTDYPVKIGKQLNQCTAEELLAHPMCGSVSLFANIAYMVKSTELGYGSVAMHLTGGAQWKEPIVGSQSATWLCEVANSGDSAKIYRRTIFVAWKSNVTMPQYSIDDTCNNEIYIVEDIKDPNKLVYNTTGQSDLGHGDGAAIIARLGALPLKHTCQKGQSAWSNAPSQVQYEDPDTLVVTNYNIGLVFAYVIGSEVFLCCKDHLGTFGGRYHNDSDRYNFLSGGSDYKSFISDNDYRLYLGQNVNDLNREATLGEIWSDCYPDPIPNPATFSNGNQYYATPNTILPYQIEFRYSMQNSTIGGSLASRSMYIGLSATTALEARKQQIARAGVYFVHDGELLKPIIQNGIVINYDTPEQPSEIDDYTDLNHPVPTTPDGGGGGGGETDDNFESMETGFVSNSGGLTRYWKMSSADLLALVSDFNQNAPQGSSLNQNIVSLYVNALSNSWSTGKDNIEIHSAGSQETPFTSASQYDALLVWTYTLQLGYIDVPRVTNTFYDFSPYTTYELFIPFCGWISLPDTVAGRRVRAELNIDISNMSCLGIVRCETANGDSVCIGEITGTFGAPCPLQIIESGLYRQAMANSALQIAAGVGQVAVAGASGNYGFAVGGASMALQGAVQAAGVGNTNYGSTIGRNGDSSSLGRGHDTYLKITHPVIEPVVETTGFAHSIGYMCNEVGKLNDFKGFTVCGNPHITGINATDAEKEEIKQLLESGIIL